VNARETALVGAVGTLTQSIKGAYATRAEALQQAYALTPVSSVKAAVKIAWSVFNGSIKSANATWKISRDAVWAQFKTAVKTCQAPAVTSDATMSSADVVVR
jgi:Flp pilus assembly pilin Flp